MTSKLKLQVDQLHKGSAGLKILLRGLLVILLQPATRAPIKFPCLRLCLAHMLRSKPGKRQKAEFPWVLRSEEPGNRGREMPQNLFWSDRSFQPRGHLASAQKSQTLPVCRSRNEVSRPSLSPLVRN